MQPALGDPAWAGGWAGWPTEVPANPKHSVILWLSMPRANRHTIIHLVPPHQKIFKRIKTGTWKLSLGRRSQARTSPDGRVDGPEPLFHLPKKGRLFGKSRASDFVRHMPGNTWLTKVPNYYLELNFCRQCVYQWQSQICDTCHLNELPVVNKLPVVSTLQNCFSESPWRGSDRTTLNLISGYTLNPLDINHQPSLGLGVDPAAPRLLSQREFGMQGGLLWTLWLNRRAFLLLLIRLLYPF